MKSSGDACETCIRIKPAAVAWRHIGEVCGHVECPHRKPVTAAPPIDWQHGPTSARGADQQ